MSEAEASSHSGSLEETGRKKADGHAEGVGGGGDARPPQGKRLQRTCACRSGTEVGVVLCSGASGAVRSRRRGCWAEHRGERKAGIGSRGDVQSVSIGRQGAGGVGGRPGRGSTGPGDHSWQYQTARAWDVLCGHSAVQVQVQRTGSHSPPGPRLHQAGSMGAESGNGQERD